ncbi:CaiB/BaiF family protein [Hyphomonas neptunium ATCC 15444]|uniref:CaiB/BaiF family protein n=2 Tax=Hyphomonas TaxID=85 RepID=Q0C372_HYPNA|nr:MULTISPECIES: CoA transferase [Hyphomonas]ABI77430.1 CaiB/BaiF family protein [Hyphomonas neptunium ATCC 15444]KCZ95944.1 CaiB/BaiF family protein [Hyphomonas hirschiana VP5]
MKRLLEGIRILSVEQYGAGPYGTQLLADLGAEVIKVEDGQRGGDVSRTVGPYLLGEGDSDFFQTFSKGKKSIDIDLKSQEGRALFDDLVKSSDAVVNNLRGDQPAKLGLDYSRLHSINPKIVCAHLSAYGRDNSRAGWPGYDYLMQAEAGFMLATGEPEGPPVRCGLSIIDFHTGSQLATAILAGILSAQRSGEGCDVDVTLFDTALHQLSYPATWYLNRGHATERLPRGAHPSIAPSQLVKTKDGWGLLMCQTPKFWDLFCELAEGQHLKADPRFATNPARHTNLAELTEVVDALLSKRTSQEWIEHFAGQVPFAPVLDIPRALDNPYLDETQMIEIVAHPSKPEGLRTLASPFRVNGQRPVTSRAPDLGEHTAEFTKEPR